MTDQDALSQITDPKFQELCAQISEDTEQIQDSPPPLRTGLYARDRAI